MSSEFVAIQQSKLFYSILYYPPVPMTQSLDTPLVSAIITTYNRPELLRRAIKSVIDQSYSHLELVVVDDCSDESPEAVIEDVSSDRFENVVFCRHEENRGVSAARNTGIEASHGELLAFLDDDDIWDEKKIHEQVAEYNRSDNVGAVYSGTKSIDSDGSIITVQRPTKAGDLTKELLCDHGIWFPTILIDRETIAKVGGFNEDMLMREDVEWVVRVSQHTEFGVVSEPLLITLRGDDHEQKSDDIDAKLNEGHPQLMAEYQEIAAQYGPLFRRKFSGYSEYNIGRAALAAGRSTEARRHLFNAVVCWPFTTRFYVYLALALLGKKWYLKARNTKRFIEEKQN